MSESIPATTAIGRSDYCSAITALLQRDITVGSVVVGRADLELYPGGREVLAALDTSLEGLRQGNVSASACLEVNVLERVVEVCASCAVTVPEIVVEEISAVFVGLVGQNNTGLLGFRREFLNAVELV